MSAFTQVPSILPVSAQRPEKALGFLPEANLIVNIIYDGEARIVEIENGTIDL